MKVHILNGDCLQSTLQAENALVVREMLVEGPLEADSYESFFRQRAFYLKETYSITQEEYQQKTVTEFEKIQQIPNHSEVFLWFDYDLFCFVNLLFVVQLLRQNKTLKLFIVRPLREQKFRIWRGFSEHCPADLKRTFSRKRRIGKTDLTYLHHLWKRLAKTNRLTDPPFLPFLTKHLTDYTAWQKATFVQPRWGLTEGQAARITF